MIKSLVALLALLMIACSPPASEGQQDMRAVYENAQQNFEMVIELSRDGHLRGETKGQDMWLLRRENINYFVVSGEDGDQVIDTRIAAEILAEIIPDEVVKMVGKAPQVEFKSTGTTTINGREGTGFVFAGQPDDAEPGFVFSDDPALDLLAEAMRDQFEASLRMNPLAGKNAEPMLALFENGAPLRFGGADLSTFEPAEFEEGRFKLPSEPLDKAQTKALMIERRMIPAEPMELPELPKVN